MKMKRWMVTRARAAAWTLGLDFLDGGHAAAAGFTFGRRRRRSMPTENGVGVARKTVSLPAYLNLSGHGEWPNATPAGAPGHGHG